MILTVIEVARNVHLACFSSRLFGGGELRKGLPGKRRDRWASAGAIGVGRLHRQLQLDGCPDAKGGLHCQVRRDELGALSQANQSEMTLIG